jgi:hypothetical protein
MTPSAVNCSTKYTVLSHALHFCCVPANDAITPHAFLRTKNPRQRKKKKKKEQRSKPSFSFALAFPSQPQQQQQDRSTATLIRQPRRTQGTISKTPKLHDTKTARARQTAGAERDSVNATISHP